MIAALYVSPSSSATADLPAPVGPQMMRSLSPAKAALYLVPREMNDCRAAVDVVRRQRRVPQRGEKRARLSLRELFTGLDCGLARDGRGEPFVFRRRAGNAVAGQ